MGQRFFHLIDQHQAQIAGYQPRKGGIDGHELAPNLLDMRGARCALEAFAQQCHHLAIAAPAADSGLVAVQYVGRKPEWRDALYNTGLYFVADQVRNLPAHTARQLLRHTDLFREAKVEVAPEPVEPLAAKPPADDTEAILEAAKEEQADTDRELQKVLDLKQTVSFMDKDALKQFALTNYNQKLDGRLSVEALREQTNQMIDQFGVI